MKKNIFISLIIALLLVISFGISLKLEAQSADSITTYVVPTITDDKIFPDSLISSSYISDKISIKASPGEYEPASFVIKANEDITSLIVEPTNLTGSAGSIPAANVDIRVVKVWYQAGRTLADGVSIPSLKVFTPELLLKDDSLVKVENGHNYLKMTTGEYFWISEVDFLTREITYPVSGFSVKDSDTLQPVNIAKDTNKQFWVTIKVPDGASGGTYTGKIRLSNSEITEELDLNLEVYPIDLTDPYLIYSIYHLGEFRIGWEEGRISYYWHNEEQFRAEMENLLNHGVTRPTLDQNFNDKELLEKALTIREEIGITNDPLYYHGFGWRSDLDINEVEEFISFAQGQGISDVYFYGRDEARGDELIGQRDTWEAVHALGGKIFVSCCCDMFDLMGDILDLANFHGAPEPEEAAKWHSEGQQIFNYANPFVGNEKPETYRRNSGLVLWQGDYDGEMNYSYYSGEGHIWNDFDDRGRGINFVYPTTDGVIDTIQWEGWREGVDDVRYLTTLLDLIDQRKADGTKSVSNAENWLASLKSSNLIEKDLDTVRSKMVEYILYLSDKGSLPSYCGNAAVESGEECDSGNLGGRSCLSLGYTEGNLACDTNCIFNKVNCIPHRLSSSFISPTDSNGVTVYRDWTQINFSADSDIDTSSFLNWDRSLTGYWNFNENSGLIANDKSTYGNNGTLINGPQWTTGKFGPALDFDGINDYVDYGNDETLNLGNEFTVEAWIRPDQAPGRVGTVIKKGQSFHGFWLGIRSAGAWWEIGDGVSGHFHQCLPDFNFVPGVWYHLVGIYDGSTMFVYINGKEQKSLARGISVSWDDQSLSVGSNESRYYSFNGAIDEVRIWNRVLSPGEIKASYNSSKYDIVPKFTDLTDRDYQYYAYTTDLTGDSVQTETRTLNVEGGTCLGCELGAPVLYPSTPRASQSFTVSCSANSSNYDCIDAYVGDTQCSFSHWSGTNAIFNCPGLPVGTYTAKCQSSTETNQGCCFSETTRTLTVSSLLSELSISFISPTDNDNAVVSRSWSEVNVNVESNIDSTGFIDWNRSLAGYWDFNENSGSALNDKSTHSNNGTLIDNPRWTTGKFGSALYFDGSNDYVSCDDDSGLNLGNEFTVEVWIKPDRLPDGRKVGTVIKKGQSFHGFWLGIRNDSAWWEIGDGISGHFYQYLPDFNFVSGNWYHLVGIYDGSAMYIYVNGEEQGSLNRDLSVAWDDSPLLIGSNESIYYPFNGAIDEVRVWNRVLSPEEIKASYNASLNNLSRTFINLTDGTYQYYAYTTNLDGDTTQTETRALTVGDAEVITCTNCGLEIPIANPASPEEDQSFTVTCPANNNNYDCIEAYVDGNQCAYSYWSGNSVVFNCSGLTAGTYTAKCQSNTGTSRNCCFLEETRSFTIEVVEPVQPTQPSEIPSGEPEEVSEPAETPSEEPAETTPSAPSGGGTAPPQEEEEEPGEVIMEKPVTEMTIEELKARIAELLTLIAQIQAKIALLRGDVTEIPTDYSFTKYLFHGQRSNDVRYLQIFLKNQGPDVYPQGLVTGYFGSLTYQAVINFQLKHNIITSAKGYGAGYVGPKTRARVNQLLGR